MNIDWKDATLRFDPNSPDPFATHGTMQFMAIMAAPIGLLARWAGSADLRRSTSSR